MLNYDAIVYAYETEIIKNILHIVIDALEANELTTIHSIISIMNAGEFLSDNRIVNDTNITALVAIVRELTNSQLIAELAIPAYNAFVAPMFNGLENGVLIELLSIDYYNYSVEKFQEDFRTIVELLELLDSEKALMKVIDIINNVDTTVVYPNSFEHIIRQAYKLNLINERTDLIREFIANLIGVDYFAIDQTIIDEAYDVNVIVEVVRMICEILENNELTKIDAIVNAMKDLRTYLTVDNCISIIDVVDRLLDLTTLHAFLIPTLDVYAKPFIPEELQDIYNNENYVLADLVADLHSVLSIAKEVVYFNIIDILLNEGYIAWENTTPIENIFVDIFELRLLGNNVEYIVDFLNTIVPFVDLYNMDLDNIDLSNDGAVLGKVYAVIAKEILASDLFPIHFMNDIKYMSFNSDDYLTKDVLNIVVDALEELQDSTIVKEVLYAAYITLLENTHEKLLYLFEQDLTRDQLVEDYLRVLDIVREVVELEVQNILISTDPDISLVGASEHINNILDIVLHSNLLGSDYARTAVGTFELFRITVAYADAASINYEHDFEVIYEFVDGLFNILINSELDSYFDIKDKIANMNMSDIINDTQLVNNDNLHAIVDLVSLVLELDLLNAAYNPVLELFFGNARGQLAPLFDFDEYTVELFVEDMYAILNVVHEFINFDLLGIYRDDAEIEWANIAPIEALINAIFTSKYLEVKLDDIINIVSDYYIDITDVDKNAIDLAGDAQHIINAYSIIANNILATPEFSAHYLDELVEFDFYLRDYLTIENLNYVVDALVEISYTTIVEQALAVMYPYADQYLPEEYAFLVSADLTGAELADDLRSILEAVRHAIALEVYNIYYEEDVLFDEAALHVNAILDLVLHTNIVSKDYVTFFAGLLSLAGIDADTEVLATVDFESDFDQIYEIVNDVFALLINSEVDSYFDAKDKLDSYVSLDDLYYDTTLVNNENILTVLDIADSIIDLSIVKAVWAPLYNEYIGEVAGASLHLEGLREIDRYSYEYFVEDAHAMVEIVRNLVAFNGLAIVRNNERIDWTNVAPMQNIIETIFDLNYLDVFAYELLTYVDSNLEQSILVDADIENIDWSSDGKAFANAYAIVALGLFNTEVFPIQYYDDISGAEFEVTEFITNEYVSTMIQAFEQIVDTTVVYELSLGVFEYINTQYVPESAQFIINDADLTKDEAVEDLHTLLSLAQKAVEFGVVDYYHNENLFLAQPELIKAMLQDAYNLNVVENSNTRISIVNKVLRTLGLAEIESVSDWDNEEAVLLAMVPAICEFLADNNIEYLTNLETFIDEGAFVERTFVTNENAIAVLDILEIAVDSEICCEIMASVYEKVVEKLPYESVQELVEFGSDARDYNKDLFVEDIKPMIELAKDAVRLGIIDLYFDRDCEIPVASEINSVIRKAVELNMFDGRLDLFVSVVFDYLGIEADLEGIDWDNEVDVLCDVITEAIPFLYENDIHTVQELLSFLREREFLDREFLSEENANEMLDIAYVAADSKVCQEVMAYVYEEVVSRLPYESVQELVEFGSDARDYNKDLFVEDIKPMIELAKDAVRLGIIDLYFDRDCEIPVASEINSVIRKAVELNMFDGRLDLFVSTVFNYLAVEVDLTGINWDNEVNVLCEVIEIVIPALHNSEIKELSDVKEVARLALDDIVSFVKDNRTYANLANAYAVVDVLDTLSASEVYMRSILKLYDRFEGKLPSVISEHVDINLYQEEELRSDYSSIIEIMREVLDSGIYRVVVERRSYAFPEEHVDTIQTIIALACDLYATEHYTEAAIRIVADVLGLDISDMKVENIDLSQDKDEFIAMVEPIRYLWINSEGFKPSIKLGADEEFFVQLSNVLTLFGETTVHEVVSTWIYKNYLAEYIGVLADATNMNAIARLENYDDDQILALYDDMITVLNEFIAMDLFGTSGVNFTDTTHLTNIYNMMLKYVALDSRIKEQLDVIVANSHLIGVVYIPYAEVTSDRQELSTIKDVVLSTLEIVRNYLTGISRSDLSVFADDAFEADVMSLLDKIDESVLLSETFIPLVNGLIDARLGVEYASYNAIPMATYAEFKAAVPSVFDIIEKANNVGILEMNIEYKDTEGLTEFFEAIENCPFIAGQETIVAKIFLRVTKKVDPESIDFSHIVWADEYQYIYAFLAKANYPLNMDGVTISSDIDATLANPEFVSAMVEALKELADSQVLVAFFDTMVEVAGSKVSSVEKYLDYSHLDCLGYDDYAAAIKAEYIKVLDTLELASGLGLVGSEQKNVNVNDLVELYDNVFSLEGIKNTKAEVLEKLVELLPSIGGGEVVIPEGIDYDSEIIAVRGIIVALGGFADVNGNINVDAISDVVINTTDVATLEQLFTALNNSEIYRYNFYTMINDHITDLSGAELDLGSFLTDWFYAQETGMYSVSEWADEVIYLARLVVIANYMKNNGSGFEYIKDMNLGVVDGTDASSVATSDFLVADYGLRQILQIMSASKTFTLTALNGLLENVLIDRSASKDGNGIIKTNKQLKDLSDAEWANDIDDLINLLSVVQEIGLLESSTSIDKQLTSLTPVEVANIIKRFNHCDAIRELLPDMIADALVNANAADYKSEWLNEQCGVDANGVNNPMASVEEWDAEADQMSKIITSASEFNLNSLNLASLTNEEIDKLGELLVNINLAKSLNIDKIVDVINSLLATKGYADCAGDVADRDGVDGNVNEWNVEIPRLMEIVKIINSIGNIDKDSINTKAHDLGELLDTMKTSYIFGNDTNNDGNVTVNDNAFNTLIVDILETSGFLKNSSNQNGFIDETQAATTDWSQYNWTSELEIVTLFDTEQATQTDDTIKNIAGSQIIKDFFDIATVINDKIAGISIAIGTTGITLELKDYVNNGQPLTNEQLRGRDWAAEIDDMNAIIDIFNNGYRDGFKSDLEALIASGHNTLAVETATSIKADLQARTYFGVSVWDILL